MSDITVTLPDGSSRLVPAGSTPADVARLISPGLAKAALAAFVDGHFVDLTYPITAATSRAVDPEDTRRLLPSGSVTVISDIFNWQVRDLSFLACFQQNAVEVRPAFARSASFGVATFAWLANPPSRCVLRRTGLRWLASRSSRSERRLVGTGRLELPTSCVSSRRSNQLSYAPMS